MKLLFRISAHPFLYGRFSFNAYRAHRNRYQSLGTVPSETPAERHARELDRIIRCYESAFGGSGYSGVKPSARLAGLQDVADYIETHGSVPGHPELTLEAVETRRIELKSLEETWVPRRPGQP